MGRHHRGLQVGALCHQRQRCSSAWNRVSAPCLLPVHSLQGKDDEVVVVQFAQNSVVADAVPLDSGFVSHEAFAVRTGIVAAVNVLPKPCDYQPARLLIKFLKLLNGLVA